MMTKLSALDFSQVGHKLLEEIRDFKWSNKMKGKKYVDKWRKQPPLTLKLDVKSY